MSSNYLTGVFFFELFIPLFGLRPVQKSKESSNISIRSGETPIAEKI